MCCPTVHFTDEEKEAVGKPERFWRNRDGWWSITRVEEYAEETRTYCTFVTADYRCEIYEKRPQVCREYVCDGDSNP
jgi:Fe-S-cluster containining protein